MPVETMESHIVSFVQRPIELPREMFKWYLSPWRSSDSAGNLGLTPTLSSGIVPGLMPRKAPDQGGHLAPLQQEVGLMQPDRIQDARELEETRNRLLLNRTAFAQLLGSSVENLRAWEAGHPIDDDARRRMFQIARLLNGLKSVMDRKEIAPWMGKQSQGFQGKSPLELIACGEINRIWMSLFRYIPESVD